ncbi:MAG: hypothetical protein WC453_04840 [Patescibacteria group bacterium]
MSNLISVHYWFDLSPEPLLPKAQMALIGLVVLLAILAIATLIIKRRGGLYRGFLNRLYSLWAINTIIGLILLFFNYETVPFFSARFWLGLWSLAMLFWLILVLKKLKAIPQQKKRLTQEQELKKYLP